jgi:hypothetical protein
MRDDRLGVPAGGGPLAGVTVRQDKAPAQTRTRKGTLGTPRVPTPESESGLADLPVGAASESEREQRPYCNGNTLHEVHEPPSFAACLPSRTGRTPNDSPAAPLGGRLSPTIGGRSYGG